MTKKCDCIICRRNKWLAEVLGKGDVEELKDAIEKLVVMLEHAELDNEVHDAIMSGTWPSAVRQLSHALRRAIEYEEENKKGP